MRGIPHHGIIKLHSSSIFNTLCDHDRANHTG
ncbi:Uncharacterised protein [Vibrio cholerae]|nr:Uncharacterised protein [Vibrio cholerae]